MLYLPKNVACIADVASKDATRWAVNGIRVMECADDWYRLEATDGKVLVVLQGPSVVPDGKPAPEGLGMAPNGETEAVLLARSSKHEPALGLADCLKGKIDGLYVALGKECATACTHGSSQQIPVLEGRWPNCDSVIPKKPALIARTLNAGLLMKLLAIVQAIDPDQKATLLFWGPTDPVGVICKNANGQTADCLIVPLTK